MSAQQFFYYINIYMLDYMFRPFKVCAAFCNPVISMRDLMMTTVIGRNM